MPSGTYLIYFNANSGSGAPATLTGSMAWDDDESKYYAYPKLPTSKPSRTYYSFLGWARSSSATSAAYAAGATYAINTTASTYSVTLFAVWKRNTAYVYYNANGGTGAPATQSHNAGSSITLSGTKPTRNGYKFLGWATSASATSAQYQPSTSYNLYVTTTLYAVWKTAASTLSAPNGDLGDALTITITREVNTYTDTITWNFGTQSGTIATKTSAGSVSWTPAVSLASEFPNSASGPCVLTCTTYNGDTLIGTTTKTITLTVPQSLSPTVSVSYADTIAQCLTWGIFVQSRSKLAFSITASGQQSATIASYSTSVNGTSYNSASFTTDVLLYNGTNSYTVTVTDSRGLQTVSTGTFSVVAYSNPSLTLTLCDRNDSDPDQVDVAFDFSVASVSSNNEAKYRLDRKLKSASTWTNGTVQNLGSYSGSISDLIANLDGGDEWDIRINVIDSFQTASVESEVGVAGNILLNSRHNGGLGILMKSQADDQCDIGKPTVHHGAVLEQFGSTVASHSASGNYAKVVTFGTDVQASRNLLYFVNNVVQSSNGITLTTHKDGSITITGTASANTNLNLDFGNAGQATFEEIDNGTTYYWSAVVLSGTITGTSPTIRGGYYGDAVAQSSAHTVGANSCVSSTVPSSGTYYARTYIHIDSGTKFEDVVIGVMMTLNNVSAYSDYEPYVDATNMDVNKPLTVEYIRTGDTSPTELTIGFTSNYSLDSFTSNNSLDAYLHLAGTAKWILYIGKASASDSVEILDFHNPWSNTDMTVEWEDTSISTLPTGATQATGACKTGTMTLGNGASALGEIRVKQSGRVVNVSGYAQGTFSSGSTGYLLGTISGVDMPSDYIRAVGGCGTQNYYAYNSAYLILDPSTGAFTARCSENSSYVTFNLTYIAD